MVSHKREERIYQEEELLSLRLKRRLKRTSRLHEVAIGPRANSGPWISCAAALSVQGFRVQGHNTPRQHSSLGGLNPEEYRRTLNRGNQSGQSPNFRRAYSVE